MSRITSIDHVQIAAPPGGEAAARKYYGGVLEMTEIAKPAALRGRGGVWFQAGGCQLHVGIEEEFVPARKAHPAFSVDNVWELKAHLSINGIPYTSDTAIPGVDRIYVSDPFGNRLEFLQVEVPGEALLARHNLRIVPLTDATVYETKRLIAEVVVECFGRPGEPAPDIDKLVARYDADAHFADMDNHGTVYGPPGGIFLLLIDGEQRIVGTGAVRALDDSTAELKRMWFLPQVRGKGLGRLMGRRLIGFAKEAGYARIRLDSGSNLTRAGKLYRSLGFREIENYNGSTHCDVFMELTLEQAGG